MSLNKQATSRKTLLLNYLGVTDQVASHKEKILSGVGAFLGILAILLISTSLLDKETAVYIIPSMGASAVLLFAAPNAPFSQPWNVFGGHIISAIIGVSCALLIDNLMLAATLSVGISVTVMYYTRCTHPPGGATALAAVIGSTKLQALGYFYVLAPTLLNTVTILLIAVIFNTLMESRYYPSYLSTLADNESKKDTNTKDVYQAIRHEDFVYALSQMDSFVDISENDLLKIYTLATGNNPLNKTPNCYKTDKTSN